MQIIEPSNINKQKLKILEISQKTYKFVSKKMAAKNIINFFIQVLTATANDDRND